MVRLRLVLLLEGSTFGNNPNAALVNIPAIETHEAKKAFSSCPFWTSRRSAMIPAKARTGNTVPHGVETNCLLKFGWMAKLIAVTSSINGTNAFQHRIAKDLARSCKFPSVFSTTQRLPWIANVSVDARPTKSVNQSIIPTRPSGDRLVHNGRKKITGASTGKPRIT